MSCPRNFTKDQIVTGLKAGRTLIMDRSDAPEFLDLLDLEREGIVTQELVEIDDQSSAVKWRWRRPPNDQRDDRAGREDMSGMSDIKATFAFRKVVAAWWVDLPEVP